MKISTRTSFIGLLLAFFLFIPETIFTQTTHSIVKTTGTPIVPPAWTYGDVVKITGAALESGDWETIRALPIHLELNQTAQTEIPGSAFYNAFNLSISGDYVTRIASNAFYASGTQNVSFPNATTIDDEAFVSAGLTSIDLPNVETVGNGAFAYCRRLVSVNLPKVTFLDYMTFYTCISLKDVNIPLVTHIGASAFTECTSLENFEALNVEILIGQTFSGCTGLKSVNMPKVKTIGGLTFARCSKLIYCNSTDALNCSFPEATELGGSAFSNCNKLQSMTLPKVTTVGGQAFGRCSSLRYVNLSQVRSIGYEAFLNCSSLVSIFLPEVMEIQYNAFENCSSLIAVHMPKVSAIADETFKNCSSLIGGCFSKATSFGKLAFQFCKQLRYLQLGATPPSVVLGTVGETHSFLGVDRPIEILVPDVASYTDLSMYPDGTSVSVSALRIVERTGGTLQMPAEHNNGDVLLVADNIISSDLPMLNGLSFSHHLAISISEIPAGAFLGNTNILSVTLLNSNENATDRIKSNAFKNCTSLTKVDMPTVGYIEANAFDGCTQLEYAFVGHAKEIGSFAFSGCTSLSSMILSEVTTMGNSAFRNCTSLQYVAYETFRIPSGSNCFEGIQNPINILLVHKANNPNLSKFPAGSITSPGLGKIAGETFTILPEYTENDTIWIIGDKLVSGDWKRLNSLTDSYHLILNQISQVISVDAFIDNSLLLSVTGPTISGVGQAAFAGCTSLTGVDFPSVTRLHSMAFTGCLNLVDISFPEVVYIGDYAFDNCKALTQITLPKAVSIGQSAFSGCSHTVSFSLPEVTSIGGRAFDGCTRLTVIDLPKIKTVSDRAFFGCTALTKVSLHHMNSFGLQVFNGGCVSLKAIEVDPANSSYATLDGILYNKNITKIIAYPAGIKLNGYFAPASVTSVANSTFLGCPHLTSVSFTGLTAIEADAFNTCTRLLFMELGNTQPAVSANSFVGMDEPLQLLVPNANQYDNSYMMQYPANSIVLTKPVPFNDYQRDISIQGVLDSIGLAKQTMARPVAYATVILYGKSKTKSAFSSDLKDQYPYLAAMTQADQDGFFQIDVPCGDYLVWIEMPGYTVVSTLQVGSASAGVRNVNFFLDESEQRIIGSVTSSAPEDREAIDATFYPNPAVGNMLTIKVNTDEACTVRVYNTSGQLVEILNIISRETTFDIGHWRPGLYLMRVSSKGKESVYKLIKN